MTTIDNTHKAKHKPGAGFAFPSHAGTTQHTGLTIRAEIASRIFAGLAKLAGSDAEVEKIVDFSLRAADVLIDKLYPAPVAIAAASPQAERGVCQHLEVVIGLNNTYQCLQCRQGVPAAEMSRRIAAAEAKALAKQ